ncbi:MAG: hypothetical protein R3A52_16540 [Polyangiales bacterium]
MTFGPEGFTTRCVVDGITPLVARASMSPASSTICPARECTGIHCPSRVLSSRPPVVLSTRSVTRLMSSCAAARTAPSGMSSGTGG